MSLSKLRRLILSLGRSEDGTAITEFVIFLPIWIFVFIGIINLGRVGIFSTQVQLRAQKDLWDQSVQVTSQWESIEHQSAAGAAVLTAADYFEVKNIDGNDQEGNDFAEGVATGAGMGLYGHYGESAEKAFIPASVAVPASVRGKYSPEEIMGVESGRFPHLIMNDTLAEADFGGSSVIGIIAAAVAASGFVQSTAAGIRYGSVFTNKEETMSFISNFGSFKAGAHYDALVSPRAINGAEAEILPFSIAFLMFKADETGPGTGYKEFLLFGDENWGGGHGSDDSRTPEDTSSEEADAEVQEECDNYNSSYTGDYPGGDDPKPSWWDTCN